MTLLTALVLIMLGVGAYLGTGRTSTTALIPTWFGLALGVAGAVALWNDGLRKHAMHAAAAIALLGALGAGGRAVPKLMQDGFGTAIGVQLAMTAVCVVFVIACVRSFMAARRAAASG